MIGGRSVQICQDGDGDATVRVVRQERVEAVDATIVLDDLASVNRPHGDAERVVVQRGRGHLRQRLSRDNLPAEQRQVPAQQVLGRRVQGAGGERDGHVQEGGVIQSRRARHIS